MIDKVRKLISYKSNTIMPKHTNSQKEKSKEQEKEEKDFYQRFLELRMAAFPSGNFRPKEPQHFELWRDAIRGELED